MNKYEIISLIATSICLLATYLIEIKNIARWKYACMSLFAGVLYSISHIGIYNIGAIIGEIPFFLINIWCIVKALKI